MEIIICSSLVSTLVTRWAFKRSCFLINVSMSTSVLFLSLDCVETTRKDTGPEVPLRSPFQLLGFKRLQLQLHFSERNPFYGIGTVITVLVGTLALRLGIGWRSISLTLMVVPLIVVLGFLNVDLPPLISNKQAGRIPIRDLCRNSSFVAVNVAIFLGGALELGLAQWLPAYAEMSLGFSKSTGSVSLLAFSAAMALGRIFAGLIGRRVEPIRLMLGCCWISVVLFLLACFAPWPAVALAASVAVGLAGSCLWPTTLGVAADRFPRGGATMFGLLAAFGNLGGILMPWLVGVTSDWSSLRLGLATSTACPLLTALVLLWMQRHPVADFREGHPVAQAA
jgi:predicted MFS family arabinose efflux permease